MIEFIETFISGIPFSAVEDRNWQEIALILAPTVLLIIVLFLTSFSLKIKFFKKTIHIICITLSLVFLPYELFRQANEMSKADTNIAITQESLKELLGASNLNHVELLADKEAASKTLEKLLFDVSKEEKQALLTISWLIAENEIQARLHQENKYQSLSDNIQSNLMIMKEEIIDSRPPVEKISDDILHGIEQDLTQLIETKMESLNEDINHSLENFQANISDFIKNQVQEYDEALELILQKNVNEFQQHANKEIIAITRQVNEANLKSMQKLQDTKNSVDNVGEKLASVNLQEVVTNMNQLSVSVGDIKKRNKILFTYNECLRTVGLIDLAGKEAKCRDELNEAIDELKIEQVD